MAPGRMDFTDTELMRAMWDQIRDLHACYGDVPVEIRLLKVTEEVGEAAEAFIGTHGLNSRKGVCRSRDDLLAELADVIITAAVAMTVGSHYIFRFLKYFSLSFRLRTSGEPLSWCGGGSCALRVGLSGCGPGRRLCGRRRTSAVPAPGRRGLGDDAGLRGDWGHRRGIASVSFAPIKAGCITRGWAFERGRAPATRTRHRSQALPVRPASPCGQPRAAPRFCGQAPGPGASEPPDGWRQPRRPATRSATHTRTRASAGDHPADARKETFA